MIDVTQRKAKIDDWQPIIQEAIDSAAGKLVYLPAGQYRINSPIVLTGDGTTLCGDGPCASVLTNYGEGPSVVIRGSQFAKVEELCVNGYPGEANGGKTKSGSGIVIEDAHHALLRRVHLNWHGGHGVEAAGGCWNNTLEHVRTNSNKLCGVHCIGGPSTQKNAWTFDHLVSLGNGQHGLLWCGASLRLTNSTLETNANGGLYINTTKTEHSALGGVVTGNHFENNTAGNIALWTASGQVIHGLFIVGNYLLADEKSPCIYGGGAYNSLHVAIGMNHYSTPGTFVDLGNAGGSAGWVSISDSRGGPERFKNLGLMGIR
jgi:hypothetical protein